MILFSLALAVRFTMEGTLPYVALAFLLVWLLHTSLLIAKTLNKSMRSEMRLRHKSHALAYVLEKIRKGRDDISNGRHYTTEEAKERLSRWLKP